MKLFATLLLAAGLCSAQTQIVDTLYTLDSTPFKGTLRITWPPFITAAGQAIGAGVKLITVTDGVIDLALWPTQGAGPATSYTVATIINNQPLATERWGVPVSATPVTLASVRSVTYSGTVATGSFTAIALAGLFSGTRPCYLYTDGTTATCVAGSGGGGGGGISSITLTVPSILTVGGSPLTANGTLALTLATQAANKIWAGPTTGSAAAPTFRSLVAADVPTLNQNTTGTAATADALSANPTDCTTDQFATSIAASGNLGCAQVAYSQVSGTPTLATVATSGSASDLGAGTLPAARMPALTGDATSTAGTVATTVGKINGVALSGLATGILKSTTGTGAPSIATAGTDYIVPGGALGTPSSGSAANLTSFPTLNQNTTGNAATSTALAANGTNCSAGSFPLGVDASGASESCTALPTTITGTANQIAASAATGAVVLSIPSSPTLPGTTSGTFSGNLTGNVTGNVTGSSGSTTGNAATATALASTPSLCSTGSAPTGVLANGNATGCATLSGGGTVTVASAGSLTSTAIVTGAGSQALQTPSATATVDTSGNISTPGTLTTGAGGSVAGSVQLGQGTTSTVAANSILLEAPSSVTTAYKIHPPAAPCTGLFLSTNTSSVLDLTCVSTSGSGSAVLNSGATATNLTLVTPTLGVATGTSFNGLTITTSTGTITIPNGVVLTGPASSGTAATLGNTETFSGDKAFTGKVDASGATQFFPKSGTSLPATCTVGEVFNKTNATAGQNWYFCTATNTWTQQLNSGGGGGITSVFGNSGPTVGATGDIGATGTVLQVNGATVPVSATVLGSNGSSQLTSTTTATTKTNNAIVKALSTGYIDSTFTAPAAFFSPDDSPTSSVTGMTMTAINQARYFSFTLPYPIVFSTFMVNVKTADSTNLYDLALYDFAGGTGGGTANLVAHTGPTANFSSTGQKSIAASGAPFTLAPGRYYFAVCTNGSTFAMVLSAGLGGGVVTTPIAVSTTTSPTPPASGTCPATLTMAADSWTTANVPYVGFR
jgi:hypothetical protein